MDVGRGGERVPGMRVGESCACRHRQHKSSFDARQLRREPRQRGGRRERTRALATSGASPRASCVTACAALLESIVVASFGGSHGSAGAPGKNEGAGDVWRVATRQLPHRIHSLKALAWPASDGVAAARGYAASRGSAVPGSNARTQHIHVLLAAYPRATASFGAFGSWLRSLHPSPSGRGAGVRVGTSRHAGIPTLSPTPLPGGEGLFIAPP